MASVDILSMLNKTGSGINLSDLSTSLVAAAVAAPKAAAEARAEKTDVAVSALGALRAQLAGLAETAATIARSDVLSVASSSAALRATVSDRAAVANTATTVDVLQLAAAQVLEFGGFGSGDDTLPGGSITVDFGVWYPDDAGEEAFAIKPGSSSVTLAVDEGMTLRDLASRLSAIPGVSAAMIDKGDGTHSLGLVGEAGAGNALRLTVVETTAGSGLAALDTTASNAERQVQAAANAVLTVNGVTIQRDSNLVENAIPGLTLTLAATGGPLTVTAGRSSAVAQEGLQLLVSQLNAARGLLASLSARASTGSEAGALPGDPALRQIAQGLDSLLRTPIPGYGSKAPSAADFGIRTRQDGTLYLDQAAFTKAFDADPDMFDALFADRLVGKDVTISGAVPPTFLPGSHSFRRDPETGAATLDGGQLAGIDLGDGRFAYSATTGPARGLIFTVSADVESAEISRGISLSSRIGALIDAATAGDGVIATAEGRYADAARDTQTELDQIEARAKSLQDLYTRRFAAMEQAVSKFNSTSSYLDSLVKQWNNDD